MKKKEVNKKTNKVAKTNTKNGLTAKERKQFEDAKRKMIYPE